MHMYLDESGVLQREESTGHTCGTDCSTSVQHVPDREGNGDALPKRRI